MKSCMFLQLITCCQVVTTVAVHAANPDSLAPRSMGRSYANQSVLATGRWYQFAVTQAGVYKLDVKFLSKLGINTGNLSSANIRLFGNGGQMLPEDNARARYDDLVENAIQVHDGGDGLFDNNDYLLFFAPGPHGWLKDSLNQGFRHQKHLYTDTAYYFLNVEAPGRRIALQGNAPASNVVVQTFNERQYYENDLVNFLNSGREWYGEAFSNAPGSALSRVFHFTLPRAVIGSRCSIRANLVARSSGVSRFDLLANGSLLQSVNVGATGNNYYDPFARAGEMTTGFSLVQDELSLTLRFSPGSPDGQGWLNYLELNARRQLSLNGTDQLLFRDWNSVAKGNIGLFEIQNAGSTTQVWDLSNPLQPVQMNTTLTGTVLRFTQDCSTLHEYVAFNDAGYPLPIAIGAIPNQNLHDLVPADILLITVPSLLGEAKRLAAFHEDKEGLHSRVVTVQQIYNEFSSGSPDITAIRDFVKMYYDRSDPAHRPRYLLLFGSGSVDYKHRLPNQTNLVPCYESDNSLDPIQSYVSDDFFGFLDDNEDINNPALTNLLDIGIGRLPVRDAATAKIAVDKILQYNTPASFGAWRNYMTFIADDEDNNLHLNDAETIASIAQANYPVYNLDKLYLDAFVQVSNAAGSRYPDVNRAINNRIFAGTLVMNYNGHGGYKRLADEDILDEDMVNTWTNLQKLPLFITATCDFSPYDNPAIRSIGEKILFSPQGGAIALMTTTRLVFAYSNLIMNANYFRSAFLPKPDGSFPALGDAVKESKNYAYSNFGDVVNNRKFTLLGDPALTLAFPRYQVVTDSVNGQAVATMTDTLHALQKITVSGHVEDRQGNALHDFNGILLPVVFDKPTTLRTLANDAGSRPQDFNIQNSVLYKGKASIQNGVFHFSFVLPKDINYRLDRGKISYYAYNDASDANGYFNGFVAGGTSNAPRDTTGPQISAYLNDVKFLNGGLANENPLLVIRLADESGINTTGNGIGHDITAVLDNNSQQYFVLNAFYEADLDSYQGGWIRFPLHDLAPGPHRLTIKAWDVYNNSSSFVLNFTVVMGKALAIQRVYTYPNPFSEQTRFVFEHNQPNQDLFVKIHIYNVAGALVREIRQTINSAGSRSEEISWDGTNHTGSKMAKGIYFYKIQIRDVRGNRQILSGKLLYL